MSAEVPLTSVLMNRVLGLKMGQGAASASSKTGTVEAGGDKKPVSSQNTLKAPAFADPTTIVATSLNKKAQDIQNLLDGLDRSLGVLASTKDSVETVVALLEEAGGITVRARDTLKTAAGYEGNKDRLAELETRYNAVMERLNAAVSKSAARGVNLLKGDSLTTSFDGEGKSTITTQGFDLTPEGLGMRSANFTSLFAVQESRIDVMNALDIAVTLRHQALSDIMLIQTRQEFSQSTITTMADGAESLQLDDLGEEAANLLALQLRQHLSESGEPLASEAQSAILRQF
jgi:hypothetical protein